jgi:hypothetical protein
MDNSTEENKAANEEISGEPVSSEPVEEDAAIAEPEPVGISETAVAEPEDRDPPAEEPVIEPDEEMLGDEEPDQDRIGEAHLVDFDALLKTDDLEELAIKMTTETLEQEDFMKKDLLDRLLDFIFFKVQTGEVEIVNMAYPTKRMLDKELEKKLIELINIHLYPEIVFRILKFFTRNIHDADSNLYIANLLYSEEIIKSIYDTYRLFKRDIFILDGDQRALNVKRIQQYSSRSENKLSSPLDAAARIKYILEFISLKQNVEAIYTTEDLQLSSTIED